jgi:hypothetical protein
MAKKKEMNRTSGTAKRKISQAEEVRFGMKTGKPLTGSASGVKSISLKQAGEALTQGIVTTRGGKLQFAPEGLAMALPVGKLVKAAQVLRRTGKIAQAAGLEARVGAKTAGKIFGGSERGLPMDRALDVGGRSRAASEDVFPRLPNSSIPGTKRSFDIYEDPYLEGAYRFAGKVKPGRKLSGNPTVNASIAELPKTKLPKGGRTLQLPDNATERFAAIDRTFSNLGAVRPAVPGAKKVATFPKRDVGKLPDPGSVEMVKKTAKQFGQKVSGKKAKNISRLLRGRDR